VIEMVRTEIWHVICFLVLGLFIAKPGATAETAASQASLARFTIDARVDHAILSQLDVRLSCDSATPAQQQVTLDFDGSHEFTVSVQGMGGTSCTLVALLPSGQNVTYVGDGGSVIRLDRQGCHFTGVTAGHANFCQVHVEREATMLTVYKKWVGGTGEEPNVNIHLECNDEMQGIPLWINSGSSQNWELEVSEPNGIRCSVYEVEHDSFRADRSDCSDLLIMPGANEECTLVNTKVVKRIQTLNRYGLGAMILVMLAVGLLAIKRLVR
jgi:hypothetical protein